MHPARPSTTPEPATRFRTPGAWAWLTRVWVAWWLSLGLLRAAEPTTGAGELVEFTGKVEVATAGQGWAAAKAGQPLRVGDQVRTGPASRATCRLSDRSVIRVDQDTVLELRAPEQPGATRRFLLRVGGLFLLNREKPAAVEFETPVASGAIRGTEFVLRADASGATRLTLLDGAVDLSGAGITVGLVPGQEGWVDPGQPPRVTSLVSAAQAIQWCSIIPGSWIRKPWD
jgi:ferric-dicitrate binding protein FerR (iron transport regulator)